LQGIRLIDKNPGHRHTELRKIEDFVNDR